jgi:hypothetical protein
VSTNVGGWPKDANFAVVGIITNAGIGKGVDLTEDNAGVAVIQGTFTSTNTGPELIPPLSHMYVCPEPVMMQDSDGSIQPGFEDAALPPTKYLPSVHVMNSASVLNIIARCKGVVHELFENKPIKSADDLKAMLKDSNKSVLKIHESHPLALYTTMVAAHLLIYFYDEKQVLPPAEKIKFITHALNSYNSWDAETKNKFTASLDIYGNKLTKKHYKDSEISNWGENNIKYKRFMKEATMMLDNAKSNLQEKQHDCFNQTYLGLSMASSAPGKPLDGLAGHARW